MYPSPLPRIEKRERDLHAEFLAKLDEVRANMEDLLEQSKSIREESLRLHELAQKQPTPTRVSRKKK